MAAEFKTTSLDSLCELIADCPHSTPVWTATGVIVLRSQNIRDGRLDLSNPSFTDEEHFRDRVRRAEPSAGDIVITREAPMGEVCQIPPNIRCCLGQRMVLLRPDPLQADSRYLLYALQARSVQAQIMWAEGTGSTVSNLRIPDLKKLKIPSPPLPEQHAIAHILGTLDDKIELNRRRNQTLEAMARALFKDWFVDFGPVRAKMEGREPYLPADLWQLFPDRLDDEGKPEMWGTKRVSDFLSLAYGKSLPAGKRHAEGVPVYGSGGITGFHNESLVTGPAVIVGRKGTVGSLYWEDRPCFPIDTVFFVQPDAPLPFCYYLLDSLPLRDMNTDAAVPGLNRDNVYRLEIAAPPTSLIADFAKTASRLRKTIAAASGETETLAQLRDSLLPKLISGELRVTDAEKFVGASI